jgi:transposase-like protein
VRLAAMMIDGIDLKERTHVVALGISTEGVKIPLGLWEGSTENATIVTALLSDLVERGLDPEQGILFVLDGAKALRKAIRQVFGDGVVVQRCIRHKERNVLDHLPDRAPRPRSTSARGVGPRRPRHRPRTPPRHRHRARRHAPRRCRVAAGRVRRDAHRPGLNITGTLKRTLSSTNPIESMIEIVRKTQRNVKRWQSGDMALRWTAAGISQAEQQFRKITGYKSLARLVVTIEQRTAPSTTNIDNPSTKRIRRITAHCSTPTTTPS